jgi:DNA mismatch repair protein MutL
VEPRIAILPPNVIDQIAAGEVVERPASVVKELIDNAIDAGARTISVETTAGGRGTIRVVDDGGGMGAKDAVLAFERHATSKIRAVEDLWGLATMGFRGEALAAIASVGRVTLTTRQVGDIAATRVTIHGGRVVAVTDAGAPVGTTVEVANLFFNVPARLKFLKGEGTEASHVTELVARIAMARPDLHLRLRHDGRTALEVPPDRDGFARAQALLGARISARMVPVSGEEAGVRVAAYLGAPELAQTTARGVQLFVGRRPVRDRGLLHAIAMGYGELVPRGRYPIAVVLVDVPDGAVDVNVHPQKQEVRFAEPAAVAAAVRHVVQAGVARAPWRDEAAGAGPGSGHVIMTAIAGVAPPPLPFGAPATPMAARYAAQLRENRGAPSQGRLGLDDARTWVQVVKDRVRGARAAEAAIAARAAHAFAQLDHQADADRAPYDEAKLAEGSGKVTPAGFFGSLRYLGQLDLTYLVCEAEGELVLVDQHVAHERVELARLKSGRGEREIATQRMLFPTTIEVAPELVGLAEQMTGVLAQVGFEAEAFGKTTLAVKAVPGGIRHGDPTQLLRRLLDEWAGSGAPSEDERLERVLAEIACHSVVRAGDRLSASEAEALLAAMDGADFSTHGPHGRPALLRLPLAEIARRFGR